jgi:hypothetical protein
MTTDDIRTHVDPPGARTTYDGTLPVAIRPRSTDAVAELHRLIDGRDFATAVNLVADARRTATEATRTADALAAVWNERGPAGDARGWPVAVDMPNPVNVRSERQVDDVWGSVA